MSLQFSRGCPYQCEFCDVTTLFGRRPRIKTAAQTIAELDNIYRVGWRGKIYFVDDNLMGNRPVLKNELLPAIIRWKRGKRGISFHTQITMNLADDQELMDLMYRGRVRLDLHRDRDAGRGQPGRVQQEAESPPRPAGADPPAAAQRAAGPGRVHCRV